MRTYLHTKELLRFYRLNKKFTNSDFTEIGLVHEREIMYNDQRVLAIQMNTIIGKYTLVPGVILGHEKSKRDKSKITSFVDPIKVNQRQDLVDILRENGFKGFIHFWNDCDDELEN